MADANTGSLRCSCCGQIVEGVAALFDEDNTTVTTARGSRRFTRQEYKLIDALNASIGNTVTKEQIYDRVFIKDNGEGPDLKIIDVAVCKVRKRLSEIGLLIETKWGVGYRLIADNPEMIEEMKRAGVGQRLNRHRWTPELDTRLLDLMRRKFTLTACAQALDMPYRATERAMKRLRQDTAIPQH